MAENGEGAMAERLRKLKEEYEKRVNFLHKRIEKKSAH